MTSNIGETRLERKKTKPNYFHFLFLYSKSKVSHFLLKQIIILCERNVTFLAPIGRDGCGRFMH